MDRIEKLTKNEFNQATAKHLDTYITYVLKYLLQNPLSHIHGPRIKNLKMERLDWTKKKLKLINKLRFHEIFPSLQNAANVQTLWDNFKKIYELLRSSNNMDEQEIEDFTKKAKSWVALFTYISIPNKECYTLHACIGCICTKTFKGCWKSC